MPITVAEYIEKLKKLPPDTQVFGVGNEPWRETVIESDERVITRYWKTYYVNEAGHCSLCGNRGVLDTSGVKALVPFPRRNYCICPNGRALRELRGELPPPGDV